MSDKYTINAAGDPVPEPDLMTWARWLETADRKVARDQIGDTVVSTVFLGIDHGHGFTDEPLLYETMIFGGPHNDYQERCSTKAQALDMHEVAVKLARSALS